MAGLDERLMTAAAFCRSGRIVCDVGCDHARLACYLAANGASEVIASDIADGPLESARRTVKAEGVSNVRVVKSDGLAAVGFADDVVVCGMGGELIASVIGSCRFLSEDTRFILQPMTRANFLRKWLYSNGFSIIEEKAARAAGRIYTVMLVGFTGEKRDIDELFSYTGKNRDREYLIYTAHKLKTAAVEMEKSDSARKKAEELLSLSEKIYKTANDGGSEGQNDNR